MNGVEEGAVSLQVFAPALVDQTLCPFGVRNGLICQASTNTTQTVTPQVSGLVSQASPMTRTKQPMRGAMILFVRANVGMMTRARLCVLISGCTFHNICIASVDSEVC